MDLFFSEKNEQALNLVVIQIIAKYGFHTSELPPSLLREAMLETYNKHMSLSGPVEDKLLFLNQEVIKAIEQYIQYQRRSIAAQQHQTEEVVQPPEIVEKPVRVSMVLKERCIVLQADPVLECWTVSFPSSIDIHTIKYMTGLPKLVFPLLSGEQPIQINGTMAYWTQTVYHVDDLVTMFRDLLPEYDVAYDSSIVITKKSTSRFAADLKVDFNPAMQGLFGCEGFIVGSSPVRLNVSLDVEPPLLTIQMGFDDGSETQVTCHRIGSIYATQGFSISTKPCTSLSVRLVDPFRPDVHYFNDAIDLGLVMEFAEQDDV